MSWKAVGGSCAEQDLAVPWVQVKGKPCGLCSPTPAALQEPSPTAPAARERSFPSLGRVWKATPRVCSLARLPNHSFGSALSANNKAPFVRVSFPKLGLPVAKLIALLQAVSAPALFSLGLGARVSGRASWRGKPSPARSKGALSRHDSISGTRVCLYRSRQTPRKPKSGTGLGKSCRTAARRSPS